MSERTIGSVAAPSGLIGGPFGSNLVGDDYAESGIPVIRGSNLFGPYVDGEFVYVSPAKLAADLAQNTARPGDLVFTQRGTLGQLSIVPEGPWNRYVISQSQMRLRVDKSAADPRFVYFACSAQAFRRQIADNAIATGVPHINLSILRRLTIPNLPLRRQRAIAEVLGALDDKIAANARLEAITRTLLCAEFMALGIDDERGGDRQLPLTALVEVNPALPRPAGKAPVYVCMKDLPCGPMTIASWSRREPRGGARFQNGDTLLARITPCLENGKTGYVDFLDPSEIGVGSTEFIVLRARPGVPPSLPFFLAGSARFRDFAIRHMIGTSGRQRLSADALLQLPLSRPSRGGLDRFGELAGPVMNRVKSAVAESRTLAALRDTLMPLLMSGKIRVKEAEEGVQGVV
ncbi:MAG: restriction endonuclease subunit S [Dermatophilaceae bacterium]